MSHLCKIAPISWSCSACAHLDNVITNTKERFQMLWGQTDCRTSILRLQKLSGVNDSNEPKDVAFWRTWLLGTRIKPTYSFCWLFMHSYVINGTVILAWPHSIGNLFTNSAERTSSLYWKCRSVLQTMHYRSILHFHRSNLFICQKISNANIIPREFATSHSRHSPFRFHSRVPSCVKLAYVCRYFIHLVWDNVRS